MKWTFKIHANLALLGVLAFNFANISPTNAASCDPTPSGLVAWWPAEGNANDIAGTNNGTPIGGITYASGEVGQAFVFDGTNTYIAVPASPSLNIGAGSGLTIEGWIKPASGVVAPVIEWDSTNSSGIQIWISTGSIQQIYINLIDTSGNNHQITFPYTLDVNHFQHLAVTYDQGSGLAILYINGSNVASANFGNITPQTTYPLNIGRRTGEPADINATYGGLIDELGLYNRALAGSEVAAIYNAGSAGKCSTGTPPVITTQPAGQTNLVGTTASFSVTAAGTQPLDYQWSCNTTNIIGATNPVLTLASVQLSQAGNYTVAVTNLYGATNSVAALLTVSSGPSCDPAPSGLMAWWPGAGNADDNVGGNDGTSIGGITYASGEVGQAFVFNGTSTYITVPASPNLNIGATGSGLTIEGWIQPATGVVAPVIEWDSTNSSGIQIWISTGSIKQIYINLIDTLGNNHQITFAYVLDVNHFQHVGVTYDQGSGLAVLYINGSNVASANFGNITPQTTYPLNIGRRTGEPADINATYGGMIDELSLYNRALSGSEIAAIYNAGGTGKCFTPIPPVVTTQPVSETNLVGTTASFNVTASGTGPLSYQWFLGASLLNQQTNSTLVLSNVQPGQAGKYMVLVTNAYGLAWSSNATLVVNPPPIKIPVITSFSPASGAVGTVVNITGLNFSPVAGNNVVHFGAVQAVVTGASATNMVVTVPAGATFAPVTETVSGLTASSSAFFLPTFLSGGTLGSSSFASQVTLGAGSGPYRVIIADVDGDGKPDLVVGNTSDGTVWVYRNLGTNGSLTGASFAPPVILAPAAAGNLIALAVADLDGDGRLDIVTANWTLNTISIFQNLSLPGSLTTNSFAARLDIAVAGMPSAVAVGDLDGDGRPEIVVTDNSSNMVSVLQNQSSPGLLTTNSFAAPVNFAVGPTPWRVALADMDGDGKLDVVTVNQGSTARRVSVLRNISMVGILTTNSLASEVDLRGTDEGDVLAIGDLDGDGRLDLTTGSYPGHSLSMYRNVSTPGSITTNSFGPDLLFADGNTVQNAALGDLDGDGKPDVALVSQTSSQLSLFRNLSTPGSFTNTSLGPQINFASGNNPVAVAIGDLDGDGRPDVVVANQFGNTLSLYHNVTPFGSPPAITTQPTNQTVVLGGTASFSITASGTSPLSYQWSCNATNINGATNPVLTLASVQLSQAGDYEVLVTNAFGSILSSNATLVVNAPPLNIPVITSFSPGAGAVATVVNITGLNFSPVASNNIVYFGAVRAVVTGASATNMVVTVPAGATFAPVTETVSGLTASSSAFFLPTFLSGGTLGSSSFASQVTLGAGSGPYRVIIADVDGDGKPDLVVGNTSDGTVWVYRNLGTNGSLTGASFAPPVILAPAAAGNLIALAVADLDGDGRLDIVTANWTLNTISIFQNLSLPGSLTTNSFAARLDIAVAGMPSAVAVGDLDGDGRPEIVVTDNSSNMVSVLQNQSSPGLLTTNSFAAPVNFAVGPTPWRVALADMDGDGKLDVVTVNQGSTARRVSVLRNISMVGILTTNSLASEVDLRGTDEGDVLAIGDLDGDGRLDLTTGSYPGHSLSMYRNVSTPGSITTNSFGPDLLFADGNTVQNAALGDLDGDGKPDVALVSQTSSQLSLFRNLSTPGSFTNTSLGPQINFASGNNPVAVAIGDLDGDGRPDVVVANQFGNTLSLYHNVTPFGGSLVITTQPTNQTVPVGGSASFTVAASGTGPLSYQWRKGTTNLVDGGNVSGSATTNLVLASVSLGDAGNYDVVVGNPYTTTNSAIAVLTVPQTGMTLGSVSARSGNLVVVPVLMNALGVENAFFETVGYDPTKLALQNVQLGAATAGAYVQEVDTWTNIGLVGFAVLLNSGSVVPVGTNQQVALVNFQALPVTSNTTVSLFFTNYPTLQQIYDNDIDLLPAIYAGGTVTLLPAEYESDVYPRTNGDHQVTYQDWLEEGRMVAGLDAPLSSDELLRADCAPRNAPDGVLTVADWVQAGRYALGLDPLTLVTLPPTPGFKPMPISGAMPPGGLTSRTLQIGNVTAQRGQTVSVPVQLVCTTNENAVGLTVRFDPNQLNLTGITLGSAMAGGRTNINYSQPGKLGLVIALPPGEALAAGTNQLLLLQFTTSTNASGLAALSLDNSVAVLQVADKTANALAANYVNGSVSLPPQPTLTTAVAGANLQLTWPISTGTFQVQTASNPLGPWTNATLPLTTNGANATVTVTATNQQQYFRLQGQ